MGNKETVKVSFQYLPLLRFFESRFAAWSLYTDSLLDNKRLTTNDKGFTIEFDDIEEATIVTLRFGLTPMKEE